MENGERSLGKDDGERKIGRRDGFVAGERPRDTGREKGSVVRLGFPVRRNHYNT